MNIILDEYFGQHILFHGNSTTYYVIDSIIMYNEVLLVFGYLGFITLIVSSFLIYPPI